MNKTRLLIIAAVAGLFLLVLGSAVLAQTSDVPAPYTGLKNPFPWTDPATQAAGKSIYTKNCMFCHGVNGGNLATANFSAKDSPQKLMGHSDFYFWKVSEGMLNKGMPSFKSILSEEQRWQVLTYLAVLPQQVPATPSPSANPIPAPAKDTGGVILFTVPKEGQLGKTLTLTVQLKDSQSQPVKNASVQFLAKEDFFISGLLDIGQAKTDDNGRAFLIYTPRNGSQVQVVARYGQLEARQTVTLSLADQPFYQAEAGIKLPTIGKEIYIGPKNAAQPGDLGTAPTVGFRVPGGTLSWFFLLVIVVIAIWSTYFRVLYQAFRIPVKSEIRNINTRLVPEILLTFVVVVGTVLVLKLLTGPNSHSHLGQLNSLIPW